VNLVIDIGNTRTKAALFRNEEMLENITIDNADGSGILSFARDKKNQIENCIVSSVNVKPFDLDELRQYIELVLELDEYTPLPFKNKYTTSGTLGKDRIAAIAGACQLYPGRSAIIIDAGTAVTFEIKNHNEEYLGGNISPGLNMRFKALHDYTSRLPLITYSEESGIYGTSTETAINSGVYNGLLFEMNAYIELFRNKYEDLVVILTGGDAGIFENKLKKPIFVIAELTLIGLNYILKHAAKI